MSKRILIIANKWFEVDSLIAVLSNSSARPSALLDIEFKRWSDEVLGAPPLQPRPRMTLAIGCCAIEVWCIQDLMDPTQLKGNYPSPSAKYSDTAEKVRALSSVFAYGDKATPAVVVAFGTAASLPDAPSRNGCVMVGSQIFVHNFYAAAPDQSPSNWTDSKGRMDKAVYSDFPKEILAALAADLNLATQTQSRFLAPFGLPAAERVLEIEPTGVAVSSVNVVDSAVYATTDAAALKAAQSAGIGPLISFESTHGVIGLHSDAPFIFVSGITNRMGHFSDEVAKQMYTQNLIASHNAGVALAWLLPSLASFVQSGS